MSGIETNIVDGQSVVVIAMYKFVHLPDYIDLRAPLLAHCNKHSLYGTILLAEEGINGSMAGSRSGVDKLVAYFERDQRFSGMECKESRAEALPFQRMKVKLKKEIVSMGIETVDPQAVTGTRIEPKDWNDIISDPDVYLIDARNQYEIDIGAFKNAISPETETFREFPAYADNKLDPKKQKKIAMYCTGGIRCEKASAYLLQQGFEQVYQLNGGILKYLEEVGPEQSLWQGECFVFDGRVAVNDELKPGTHARCYACRRPVSSAQMASEKFAGGVSCPLCYATLPEQKRAAVKERQHQVKLANQRNQKHIGAIHAVT